MGAMCVCVVLNMGSALGWFAEASTSPEAFEGNKVGGVVWRERRGGARGWGVVF